MFAQLPNVSDWVQWVIGTMLQWILPLALLAGLVFAIGAIVWSAVWKVYSWTTSATGRWLNWTTPGDVFWSAMKIMMIVIGAALIAPLVVAWVAEHTGGYHVAQATAPSGTMATGKTVTVTNLSDGITVIKRGGCETVLLAPGKWYDFRMESGRAPALCVPCTSAITKLWVSSDSGSTIHCLSKENGRVTYDPPPLFSLAVDCSGTVIVSDP